jgi:hypothetical protein
MSACRNHRKKEKNRKDRKRDRRIRRMKERTGIGIGTTFFVREEYGKTLQKGLERDGGGIIAEKIKRLIKCNGLRKIKESIGCDIYSIINSLNIIIIYNQIH